MAVRRAALLGTLASLVLAVLLGSAAPASAHATLLFTAPAADATVADAPSALVLVFDEPVSATSGSVRLQPSAPLGAPVLSKGGRTVTLALRGVLATGVRTVQWQVTARDGDVMTGSYQFAVGPRTVALSSGQSTGAKNATPTAVLRWLQFAALALLLGELAAARLSARVPGAPAGRPRRWGTAAALTGCGAALGLTALLLGDGSAGSVLGSRPGVLAATETVAFALTAVAFAVRRRSWAVPPLAAVLVAEALRAHPQTGHPVAGPVLTLGHLTAAALWTGTLVQVLRTLPTWRCTPVAARALLAAYARLAVWLLAAVVASGLVSTLLLVPLGDLATTTYGQVLLAKLALVAAVCALALTAHRRIPAGGRHPGVRPGTPTEPARTGPGTAVTTRIAAGPQPASAGAGPQVAARTVAGPHPASGGVGPQAPARTVAGPAATTSGTRPQPARAGARAQATAETVTRSQPARTGTEPQATDRTTAGSHPGTPSGARRQDARAGLGAEAAVPAGGRPEPGRPGRGSGAGPRRVTDPQRPARAEAAALAAVLALAATLTVLPSPAQTERALPFAPPADGPVVPAGTRAGEIGISARASAGQLVVVLSAPRFGSESATGSGGTPHTPYGLTATLADPGGTTRALKLRGCGPGCFYAPAAWRDGVSRLTLVASAGQEWAGGRTGLTIAWPPRPDPGLLRTAVAAMTAVPSFTLHELVTSNTELGEGNPKSLPQSGRGFLLTEPYARGTAPVTTRLPDENGDRRIAVGFPAEQIELTLTLDDAGRIRYETAATPNHLIHRSFVYPGEED